MDASALRTPVDPRVRAERPSVSLNPTGSRRAGKKGVPSSRREFHSPALTEPCITVARYTVLVALIFMPGGRLPPRLPQGVLADRRIESTGTAYAADGATHLQPRHDLWRPPVQHHTLTGRECVGVVLPVHQREWRGGLPLAQLREQLQATVVRSGHKRATPRLDRLHHEGGRRRRPSPPRPEGDRSPSAGALPGPGLGQEPEIRGSAWPQSLGRPSTAKRDEYDQRDSLSGARLP